MYFRKIMKTVQKPASVTEKEYTVINVFCALFTGKQIKAALKICFRAALAVILFENNETNRLHWFIYTKITSSLSGKIVFFLHEKAKADKISENWKATFGTSDERYFSSKYTNTNNICDYKLKKTTILNSTVVKLFLNTPYTRIECNVSRMSSIKWSSLFYHH